MALGEEILQRLRTDATFRAQATPALVAFYFSTSRAIVALGDPRDFHTAVGAAAYGLEFEIQRLAYPHLAGGDKS